MNDPQDPRQAGSKSLRAAHRGLDLLNLYVANIQTGFGPFIAIYLTSRHWTQADIGVALSIGTITAMASEIPGGAVVDAFRSKVLVAALSMVAFAVAAVIFALFPVQLFIYAAEVLHGFSGATLSLAIAAMSLGLVGTAGMGWRLSRNSRFAALGNAIGAGIMGGVGSLVSPRAVFYLTAILTAPAFFALRPLRRRRLEAIAGETGRPAAARRNPAKREGTVDPSADATRHRTNAGLRSVIGDRGLLTLCLVAFMFTFANAPLVPLAAARLTETIGRLASIMTGVAIVVPQVIVVVTSPLVGRLADRHGRRLMLILACAMLPIHGVILMLSASPYAFIGSEVFDGVAAVCFGIMIPLVTSDLMGESGHYNLALGIVGTAMGIGASLATPAAGWVVDRFHYPIAFATLTAIGALAVMATLFMRETRPARVVVDPDADEPEVVEAVPSAREKPTPAEVEGK